MGSEMCIRDRDTTGLVLLDPLFYIIPGPDIRDKPHSDFVEDQPHHTVDVHTL